MCSDSTLAVQMRMMSQVSNAVEVTVLPPYVPSEEERASPALYASNVQALFCKALGVPAVDQVQEPPCPILGGLPCLPCPGHVQLSREGVPASL